MMLDSRGAAHATENEQRFTIRRVRKQIEFCRGVAGNADGTIEPTMSVVIEHLISAAATEKFTAVMPRLFHGAGRQPIHQVFIGRYRMLFVPIGKRQRDYI
ncbi:hypothetical protein GSH05_33010 [Burkholderia pseudomallei]|uniref:Uncharacterized protein n=1 Tax=Burkholderia mallei (strain ATCC 23344) TaxID=243160 RepID=A0A0H2WAA1_BURMA|nr:hypothetical protein BMAA1514 [Burkholderia mallei ATCC 23344]MBG1245834.1 hypothetical protein [Burkholderia pseudomallei]MBK3334294.1 hypothetical protein [Burkholderia pseudomallei]MBM5656262.1 hypothetical protein [Burkholderia pseudomallei]MWA35363.1 hypothetical protein [Burkholderia pseudomallei]